MSELKFTKEHEWLRIENGSAVVGITNYAQDLLGEVVFVDLPDTDNDVSANDEVSSLESVKAVSDVYAPISGTITKVNDTLADNPGLINSDAESDGWLFEMSVEDEGELGELMDADGYKAFIQSL